PVAMCGECLPYDAAVVERDRLVGELLPLLVSLARDHDDIAVAGESDRLVDRAVPVNIDDDAGSRARADSREHRIEDRRGVLTARVVRREQRDVRALGG